MTDSIYIDYDIHGLVGIRLINPTSNDAAAVDRQLGQMRSSLTREPDIIIRFERRMPLPGLRYLGLYTGYNDDGYYILRSSKAEAKVKIPFNAIGEQCEIVCESGLRSVPLLIAILNLTLLKKDCVPLHASAFVYDDSGILVTGWSKGGKTEAMLSFTHNGAEYVGDEWVILTGDGEKMYGLPEPVTIWNWHLEYLPEVRKKIGANKARIFKGIRFLDKIQKITQKSFIKKSFAAKMLKEAMPAFKRQLHINIPPQKLFNKTANQLCAKPEKVFFIMSHESSAIEVEPFDSQEIVRRMIPSLEYEQSPIKEHYLAYKFAFPGEKNTLIEQASELQYEILSRALAGKDAYFIRHPYPVAFPELFDVMRPYCAKTNNEIPIKSKETIPSIYELNEID